MLEKIINRSIDDISIVDEMENSFIDYAMSVIVSRAIPDVRDGLKPVHRRILYAMYGLEMLHNKNFKKSARAVGEVIAKYHPHGDSSVYEAMVRMAQPFSLRYPLIWGQGNFGSIDGDSAAAMRYTEAKLKKISGLILRDIKANTVDFQPNYDGSEQEPEVLPAAIPNLLLNGSTGIAVGMATSIPPHNLTEIVKAAIKLASNPEATITDLMEDVLGPDFPTGGIICNREELPLIYSTGKGRIIVRAKTEIKTDLIKGTSRIIITEIPYMLNKANLIIKIADLVKAKTINTISEIRDESNREGIRVIIKFKKEAVPEVELNRLFKLTQLQTNFPVNILALVNHRPKILTLKTALQNYIDHQIEVLKRKINFYLIRDEKRKHILEGLMIALKSIDAVIKTIKESKTTEQAVNNLIEKFEVTEIQAKAILEMRLQRLTGLEQENLTTEINRLVEEITKYQLILSSKEAQTAEIIKMFEEIIEQFGDERRTEIPDHSLFDIVDEDLIPQEDIVITLTKEGYVKRIRTDEYRLQHRGGTGSKGITTNDDDFVKEILVTKTHTDILFFTTTGKTYRLRGHQIPNQGKQSKGQPIINLIPIDKKQNEKVTAMIAVDNYKQHNFVFITKNGMIKKTAGKEYQLVNRSGKIAIKLRADDELIGIRLVDEQADVDIILGKNNGKAIRFSVNKIRNIGRNSYGVKGINTNDKSKVVDYAIANKDELILSISELGFGKMTDIEEYRKQGRGGKGVITINVKKAGQLIGLRSVKLNENLITISNKGTILRTKISEISHSARNTKGVTIVRLREDEKIVAISTIGEDLNNQDEEFTINKAVRNNEAINENFRLQDVFENDELDLESNVDANPDTKGDNGTNI